MVSGCLGPPGREVRKSGTRAGVRMPRVPGTEAGGGGPPRRLASGISHRGRVPGPGPCTGWAGRSPLVQPGQSADRAHLTLAAAPDSGCHFLSRDRASGPQPCTHLTTGAPGGRQVAFLPRGLRVRLRGHPFLSFRHAVTSRRCVILQGEFVPVRVLPPGGFAVTGAE